MLLDERRKFILELIIIKENSESVYFTDRGDFY